MLKNKIFGLSSVIVFTILLLALMGCGSEETSGEPTLNNNGSQDESEVDNQEKITLSIADNFPVGHVAYKSTEEVFIPALEESGQIEVDYYPAGQLGNIEDAITAVNNGVVDIAYTSSGLVAGEIPLSSVYGIPGLFDSALEAHQIFKKLTFEGLLAQEYSDLGLQPVSISATDPYEIFTSEEQVQLPEDINGLKLRGVGGDADSILDELGVELVNIASSEIYESISRGVTDGTAYSYATAPSQNLSEITEYSTLGIKLGTPSLFHFMNTERFNSLSPEIQDIILDAGEEFGKAIADNYDSMAVENLEEMKEEGVTVYELTEEDMQRWEEEIGPATDLWLESMERRGVSGAEELLDQMLEYRDEIRENN